MEATVEEVQATGGVNGDGGVCCTYLGVGLLSRLSSLHPRYYLVYS